MGSESAEQTITIRAAFSSYLILSGVWALLAVGYLLLSLKNPAGGLEKGAVIAGGVTLLWWVWLWGFRITVTKASLEYRDGFFKSSKIALSEIIKIKDASIEWNIVGRRIKVPRILVMTRDNDVAISINSKPFKRSDLKKVRAAIAS